MTTALDRDVRKMAQLVINHIDAGHGIENPAYVTDLDTLLTDIHKVKDSMGPPATVPQQVAYITRVVTEIKASLGVADAMTLKRLLAEVEAADEKIDTIQPNDDIGDVP